MNTIAVEPNKSLFRRSGVYLKLFFSELGNKRKENRIIDLEISVAVLEEKNIKLLKLYQNIQDSHEVLGAMGITHLPGGAWMFNFDALLPLMHDEDITDIRNALRKTTGH